jgi:uncharacterized protein (DUF697 family)
MAVFEVTKIGTYATLLFVQSFFDLILPLIGSVISSATAARLTYRFLCDVLQDIYSDTLRVPTMQY